MPFSVRPTSRQPVNRFFRFQSLWPWRTSTRSRSLMSVMFRCSILDVAEAEHIGHGVEPGRLAMCPQRGLQCAMGKDHAVLGLVREREPLRPTGKDHAVIAGG